MPRPRKCRRLSLNTPARFYKPKGVPMRQIDVINLTEEELEAISLADYQGLDQESAAKKMKISRSTFSRIVNRARGLVAEALVKGAALQVDGHSNDIEE